MTDYYLRIKEPTILSFYENPYRKCASIWVDDRGHDEKGSQYLIFNESLFFCGSAVRLSDRGELIINKEKSSSLGINNNIIIRGVELHEGRVRHFINTEIEEDKLEEYIIGEKFNISIDWHFRYMQMKLHSASNIIHSFLLEDDFIAAGKPLRKVLYNTYGVIMVPKIPLPMQKRFKALSEKINLFISKEYEIKNFTKTDKFNSKPVRYWQCSKYEMVCDGVHPYNTNEIPQIAIAQKDNNEEVAIYFAIPDKRLDG